MDPTWEFQAPQFVDFNNLGVDEDPTVDQFFNVDMENGELWVTAVSNHEEMDEDISSDNNKVIKQVEVCCNESITEDYQHDGSVKLSEVTTFRSRIETSDVINTKCISLISHIKTVHNSPIANSNKGLSKSFGTRTNRVGSFTPKRLGSKSQNPRLLGPKARSQVHRSLNTPTASKKKTRSPLAISSNYGVGKCLKYKLANTDLSLVQAKDCKQPSKFISQAEQILKFQSSTPPRFRSHPRHLVQRARTGSMSDHQQHAHGIGPIESSRSRLASVPQGSKSSMRKSSIVETLFESSSKSGQSLEIHGSKILTKPTVTIPEPFRLNTVQRAGEREQFEREKRQKEAVASEKREMERKIKEKELEDQLVEARKTLVHKAQPVRIYKPLEIKKSVKKVTQPVSPHLGVSRGVNCTR